MIGTDGLDFVTELSTAARGLLGPGTVGRALADSLDISRAELFMMEALVTMWSVVGEVRNYVPAAREIVVGDGSVLVRFVLADVTECPRHWKCPPTALLNSP